MKKTIVFAILAAASVLAFAHAGGTDAYGCHTDKRSGGYHCH